jgi:hypothetical protein
MLGMLNSEIHTPFALAAYLVPALPVQHLTTLATVAADPGSAFQHRALCTALKNCVGSLASGIFFRRFISSSDTAVRSCNGLHNSSSRCEGGCSLEIVCPTATAGQQSVQAGTIY